uniref:Aldedh domain-containing protein n=1 Tax=Heterorhabditis bacteriophora TaxID=37862 RepID=A0A1I7XUM1_HETBA
MFNNSPHWCWTNTDVMGDLAHRSYAILKDVLPDDFSNTRSVHGLGSFARILFRFCCYSVTYSLGLLNIIFCSYTNILRILALYFYRGLWLPNFVLRDKLVYQQIAYMFMIRFCRSIFGKLYLYINLIYNKLRSYYIGNYMVRFSDESSFLASANSSRSGLAGYVFSRDAAQIYRITRKLQVGMIGVNEGLMSCAEAAFGGVKESGLGREGGAQGIDEFTQWKYICTQH